MEINLSEEMYEDLCWMLVQDITKMTEDSFVPKGGGEFCFPGAYKDEIMKRLKMLDALGREIDAWYLLQRYFGYIDNLQDNEVTIDPEELTECLEAAKALQEQFDTNEVRL